MSVNTNDLSTIQAYAGNLMFESSSQLNQWLSINGLNINKTVQQALQKMRV